MMRRRTFLQNSVRAAGGLAVAGPFEALLARIARGASRTGPGYGELALVDDETTGLPLLKLPPGFRYVSFGWKKDLMSDGHETPGNHDGMAVTAARVGRVVLTRNHEIDGDTKSFSDESLTYDPRADGGTVNMIFNTITGRLEKSWASLSGTCRNCAGGATPWGSWLTCEETVYGPGDREEGGTPQPKPAAKIIAVNSSDNSLAKGSKPEVKKPKKVKPIKIMGFTKTHGWVFDVPAEGTAVPRPIEGMGRFVHEAVAVDPTTGVIYETEDRDTAGFYRFTPRRAGRLHEGGELEMLRVPGKDSLGRGIKVGETFSVEWVTIDDPTVAHTPGTRNNLGVFTQGKQKGAATFLRLEGCCYHQGMVYITSTNGGEAQAGQVWEYNPTRDQLRLIFESPSFEVLDMPDNLTVSPRGGIVLCEDGKLPQQRLHGLTAQGELFTLAQNNIHLAGEKNGFKGDFRKYEWAGATFSPDGQWLFANIRMPGVTFAITGPWERGEL
jgi:secreted PhoX family phosphatase